MKVVNLTSFKGGAGKTTATMLLSSTLVRKGVSVALIDADENRPLEAWEQAARANDCWDDACQILAGDDMASLEASFGQAEALGAEVTIIDTRGGGSELNNACMANADAIVVPSALTGLDIDAALTTFEYAARLLHDMRTTKPLNLLMQRVPIGRLTRSQERDLESLSTLPCYETRLHQRDAYSSMSKRGMLHQVLNSVMADPRTRIAASHMWSAAEEGDRWSIEVLQHLGMK